MCNSGGHFFLICCTIACQLVPTQSPLSRERSTYSMCMKLDLVFKGRCGGPTFFWNQKLLAVSGMLRTRFQTGPQIPTNNHIIVHKCQQVFIYLFIYKCGIHRWGLLTHLQLLCFFGLKGNAKNSDIKKIRTTCKRLSECQNDPTPFCRNWLSGMVGICDNSNNNQKESLLGRGRQGSATFSALFGVLSCKWVLANQPWW